MEVSIQGNSLLRNAQANDIAMILAISSVLLIDCIVSPILLLLRRPSAVIIADACLDIVYLLTGTVQFVISGEEMNWSFFCRLYFL